MADTKITALTALTAADPANDVIPIVDVSDTTMAASGTTKKISVNNILGASGTATLASATITGAATVGTTLGVTGNLSAAGNSTLGTGSKSTDTDLNFSADTGTQRIYLDRGGRNLIFKDVTSNIENYRITGVSGIQTWGVGGTTAMTLNSTGLGVGVTPSAWGSPYKCVQLNGGSLSVYPSTDIYLSQNAYNSGGWKRVAAGYASQYIQTNSEHRFLIAGTSSVDSAIAFTQAMTLTAAGELLVGTATTSVASGGVVTYGGSAGQFAIGHATGSTSGNAYAGFQYAGNLDSLAQGLSLSSG